MMCRLTIVVFSSILVIAPLTAQQSGETRDSLGRYLRFEDPSPLSCLLTYLPPVFIENGVELKAFIRSSAFRALRKNYGDLRAVDAIYIRAMQLTNNNTAMALFLATVSTFDHWIVGMKVPVFQLFFPLSNESEEEFRRRVRNLPRQLYADSPPGVIGDRDKLQHFFGSTFLTFVFESRHPASRIGDFIEQGEEAFIVDGALDDRDLRANSDGQEFGLALLENNRRLPSEFLRTVIVSEQSLPGLSPSGSPKCIGVW